jgi:hypothetical protein
VELVQVRALLSRIDTWQQQGPPARAPRSSPYPPTLAPASPTRAPTGPSPSRGRRPATSSSARRPWATASPVRSGIASRWSSARSAPSSPASTPGSSRARRRAHRRRPPHLHQRATVQPGRPRGPHVRWRPPRLLREDVQGGARARLFR